MLRKEVPSALSKIDVNTLTSDTAYYGHRNVIEYMPPNTDTELGDYI